MRHAKAKRGSPARPRETTFVYVLVSCANAARSYVGVTNNIARRLRQHNGAICGGARYTRSAQPWRVHAMFQLASRHDALSLEWKIKHRKTRADGSGLAGRVGAALRLGAAIPGFHRCV